MNKIFVQIASYRDPELLSTIQSLLENADNPDNLTICIAWQHSFFDKWDNLDQYKNDSRFKIIDIDHSQSKGCCWARNLTQQQYTNEDYILQIDSHHIFVKGWDTKCIQMIQYLQNKGHNKPLLTCYLPGYKPNEKHLIKNNLDIFKLNIDYFTVEGIILFKSSFFEKWRTEPVLTRYLSAHFIFTLGSWNKEILYDPDLYFLGEEISLAVRSYTHGYDLFTPNKLIAYHEYSRIGRSTHWNDHLEWWKINKKSLERIQSLLNIDGKNTITDFGLYGLGKNRSLIDYENYSGIRFRDRGVKQYTWNNLDPPNPQDDTPFMYKFKYCINLNKNDINLNFEYDGWAIAFENEKGDTIIRLDASKEEIYKEIIPNNLSFWREFDYKGIPTKWVVWPYANNQWYNRIEGKIIND